MAIEFDWANKIIKITSPQTHVTCQELINEIRTAESSWTGIAYDKIADAFGKADLGGGVVSGITIRLYSPWQIQFWAGVGVGIISDGNVVGGGPDDNTPIKPTGGDDTIKLLGAVATTIVETKAPITETEMEQIADKVWDEPIAEHAEVGSSGEAVSSVKSKTDKMEFVGSDIKATLDGEKVELVDDLRQILEFLKSVEGGRWKIENNQMIFYDEDNVTEIMRFDLYDENGEPTMRNVFERKRV